MSGPSISTLECQYHLLQLRYILLSRVRLSPCYRNPYVRLWISARSGPPSRSNGSGRWDARPGGARRYAETCSLETLDRIEVQAVRLVNPQAPRKGIDGR